MSKRDDVPGPVDFYARTGERALVCGMTGSGKSAAAISLLKASKTIPFVCYDLKEEDKLEALPAHKIVTTQRECDKAVRDKSVDFIIFRPPVEQTGDMNAMDDLLWHHYNNYRHVGIYIDEVFAFTPTGRPGRGYRAILTRGRSRGLTTIQCMQRPRSCPREVITESQKFYLFELTDKDDRRRLNDVIPEYDHLPVPEEHQFYWFSVKWKRPILFNPFSLDPGVNLGYTDDEAARRAIRKSIVWI